MRDILYKEIFENNNTNILYKIRDKLSLNNLVGERCDILAYEITSNCEAEYDEDGYTLWLLLIDNNAKNERYMFIDSIIKEFEPFPDDLTKIIDDNKTCEPNDAAIIIQNQMKDCQTVEELQHLFREYKKLIKDMFLNRLDELTEYKS